MRGDMRSHLQHQACAGSNAYLILRAGNQSQHQHGNQRLQEHPFAFKQTGQQYELRADPSPPTSALGKYICLLSIIRNLLCVSLCRHELLSRQLSPWNPSQPTQSCFQWKTSFAVFNQQ